MLVVSAIVMQANAFVIQPQGSQIRKSSLQMTVLSYNGKKKNFAPGSPLSTAVQQLGVKVTYSCKKYVFPFSLVTSLYLLCADVLNLLTVRPTSCVRFQRRLCYVSNSVSGSNDKAMRRESPCRAQAQVFAREGFGNPCVMRICVEELFLHNILVACTLSHLQMSCSE